MNYHKGYLIALGILAASSAQALDVGMLRTQYLKNPLGIDCESPKFSWQLTSDLRATMQESYHVEIATDKELSNIVFDSGEVASSQSVNIELNGLNLMPSTRYFWRVTVTDNHGETAASKEEAFFETGLMNSGWGNAIWIAPGSGEASQSSTDGKQVVDYTIDTDISIDRAAAGLIWGAVDHSNYYMWQINIEQETPRFRPHRWNGGVPAVLKEIPIGNTGVRKWETCHLRIEVTDGGTKARTYINDILVDERDGSFPYGQIGMRSDHFGGRDHKVETAYYDYFKVSDENGNILFEDNFDNNESFGIGEIFDGQLYVSGQDPQLVAFQNNFTTDANVKNYSFEGKFTIDQFCAGIAFAAKDADNFYMWQINIEKGFPRFRPHRWNGGTPACLDEIDLRDKVDIKALHPHTFRIVVSDNGKCATTYIDGIEIDSREGDFAYDKVGFRHSKSEGEYYLYEHAYFDNVTVTDHQGTVLYSENFEDPAACSIAGGEIIDGRYGVGINYLDSDNAASYLWAVMDSENASKIRYDIDADITLLHDAASVIFSYTKPNSYFMWAINTNDNGYPIVRRHVYANSTNPQFSDTRIAGMSNQDFLNKEVHLLIEVDGSTVKTYVDGTLVDTFNDNTGLLVNGLVGFRVFKDAVDERAYWDNVKLTVYDSKGNKHVSLSEDFEGDTHEFSSGEVVDVNGNHKLYSYSKNFETKIMQDAVSASPRFRKEFTLGGKVKSAKLYTSGLGVYTVYVNGRRVGHLQPDGNTVYDELMPGWSDYRSSVFYMTHDVTSLLNEGANVIGATVSNGWWAGDVSHGIYQSSGVAFMGKLLIELENGTTMVVDTDTSWLTSRSGAIKSGEIYHGEIYDARLADGWSLPGYDVSIWNQAVADNQAHGKVMAHEGATVRVMPEHERKPQSITVYEGIKQNGSTYGEINSVAEYGNSPVVLRKGQTMVVDFGQNASGWAKFKVKGAPGTTLSMRYAEMLNDSGEADRGNDDAKGTLYTVALRSAKAAGQYTLCGDEDGEQYNPTSTFYGFRYMDMTASNDVEIEWITAETISSVVDENSSIAVNDADVNQLYSNILWGQRSNFVSVPTDCPQRDERLGWTADTQVFSMAAMYNAQVQGFYHKWMRDMRDGQLDNGCYPNVAPFNWVEHGSAAWADAGIILPWNVYLMYGDKSIIEENYESMERYMDWLATQSEGQYQFVGSDTRYGDWLAFEETDKRFVSVAYYGYMADLMCKMSAVLSESEGDEYARKSEKYATLFSNIKQEFKKRYWVQGGRSSGLSQTSQCAYLLALRYNMLPDEAAVENIIAKLRSKIENNRYTLSTGFLGTAVLNQTLSQFGMDDLAYALLLQHNCPSWLYSVDQGATTIWERWNSYTIEGGISKSIEMNSFNHYAYGAVADWMYRYMAGIAPDEQNPGFAHIILKPSFDNQNRINNVNASFGSNYGPIDVEWQTKEDGSYNYCVNVPANTTATLVLPHTEQGVFEGGIPVEQAEGISGVEDDGENVTMQLGSGKYVFNAEELSVKSTTAASGDISVYPNPVNDVLTVVSANEIRRMELRSVSGVLMASVDGSNTLDMSRCAPAIYFLTVSEINGHDTVVKVVKR